MESKSKKFTRKLVALFLAVIMALSCFTGAMTAFANSTEDYHDSNLIANFMEWADATDEQTAEALLDYLDSVLSGLNASIYFSQNIVIATIEIDACIDSVDGLLDLVGQANDLLDSYGSLIGGDVKNVDLSPMANLSYSTTTDVFAYCGKSYRAVNDAKDIIRAIAETLYINSNDIYGKNVINQFILGSFDIGSILEGVLGGSIFEMLQGLFGMWDGYESNLVYNIVANLIFSNTLWYTDEEVAAFKADMSTWNFDDQLFSKLGSELLAKINVLVTYPREGEETDTSITRRNAIDAYMEANGCDYATAASALGYDPNLVYSEENTGNILLFTYGDETINFDKNTTLYDFALQAVKLAWKTVLRDTVDLLHVNYDVDRGHGTNFDNQYYYWVRDNLGWDTDDYASNYSEENVAAWAGAVYEAYGAVDADEFLGWVQNNFEHDRAIVDEPTYTWRDIDATKLFNKIRYSPLADLYFDMQTGPINLYFLQLGNENIDTFFDDLAANNTYSSVLAGLNDALVAACKDIFVVSDNIMYGDTAITAPTLATTGDLDVVNAQAASLATIVETLATNALKVVEYTANAADMNILNAFYTNNSITFVDGTYNLTEKNLEEAMMPLLVTMVDQIVMLNNIHDETWDSVGSAEALAIVALEENLAYVLPDNDYSSLYTYDADGKIVVASGVVDIDKNGTVELLDSINIMARDALGYQLGAIAPLFDENGDPWSAYTSEVTDTTSAFDLINGMLVYYAEGNTVWSDGTQGQGLAQLLGCVDGSGNSLVNLNNDLWTNIDNIFNHLLPVIGEMTGRGWGNASSYELIYEGIIQSFLNISDIKDTTYSAYNPSVEYGGVRNFLAGLGTALSSPALTSYGVGVTVYDNVVVPLINAIFGARYSGQGYTHILPYSCYYDADSSSNTSSSTPWDSFLHVDTLGTFSHSASGSDRNWTYTDDGQATGMIGMLICNIYEAFGGMSNSSYINLAGVDGCWQGLTFAVQAVSTFIPGFVPQLREHEMGVLQATIDNAAQSGLTSGSSFESATLNLKNTSTGLNRFYEDSTGTQQQDGRYVMNVTNITVTDTSGNAVSNVNLSATSASNILAEESVEITISGTTQTDATDKVYVITATYNITKDGETLYSGIEAKAYFFLSTNVSWADTVYPDSRWSSDYGVNMFPTTYEPSSASSTTTYTYSTAAGGTNKQLFATFPNSIIVPMSDPASIQYYGFRVRNTSNSLFGSTRAFDGVYVYPTAGQEYQVATGVSGDVITTDGGEYTLDAAYTTVGYAAIDKSTGDILNYDLYDYSTDGGTTWNRSSTNNAGGYQGYTYDEIVALGDAVTGAEGFMTRTHVVWTIQEAVSQGIVTYFDRDAVGVDANGNTEYVYNSVFVTPTTELLQRSYADSSKQSITWGTPTPGIYLASGKQEVSKAASVYSKLVAYDGVTALEPTDYDMVIDLYTTNNNNMIGTIHVYIVDDTQAANLQAKYNSVLASFSQYRESDFNFTDGVDGYAELETALGDALAAVATPISESNATSFSSTYISEAGTVDNWTIWGDPAYAPLTTSDSIPASVAVGATQKDGYWYYNDECTMSIYKPVQLTDADVTVTGTKEVGGTEYTVGTDVQGTALIKGDDGIWYLQNLPKYETEWDTTTYSVPYLYETDVQVSDDAGNLCYEEIVFVYRDANGNKCTSVENWAVKLAETNTIVKPNDGTDYRGLYQLQLDNLTYWYDYAMKYVDGSIAQNIVDRVTNVRTGMNNVNHVVQTYETMVKIAKIAEAMVTTTWVETTTPVTDAEGNQLYDEATGEALYEWEAEYSTTYPSLLVEEAIRMFELYFNERVTDRGYIGDKLEDEIVCATNYSYDAYAITSEEVEVLDAEGNVVTDEEGATVTETVYTSVAADPALGITDYSVYPVKYGTLSDSGELVNEGEVVYTEESWNNYINALGAAIDVADQGNADSTDEDARVSAAYTARFNLMVAENELEEVESSSTITVSGTIVIATDLAGTAYTSGITGINVTLADGTVVATSAADGTFTAEVPVGTTELIITGSSTIDRTVTLAGDANVEGAIIPVCICDYNKDGGVTGLDTAIYAGALSGTYNVYMDINVDGSVSGLDTAYYSAFVGNTVAYDALTLA